MRKFVLAAIGVLALSAWPSLLLAADPGVKIATKEGLGSYLVDGAGKSLYWFTKDSPGTSVCEGPCLEKWPVFFAGSAPPGAGLKGEDFGTLTRAGGVKQSTFRGYPLYFWAGDAVAGDAKGQGVNGVWFVIDPANFPPRPAK